MFILSDDGTMDTVLCCPNCGEEQRYTFQPTDWYEEENEEGGHTTAVDDCGRDYGMFVTAMLTDANDEHECNEGE